ncbi:MAG: hypothetical protein FWC39_11290 [Bacteroidetes bacterium]|nr:hypothetical protein [Bacteroidota bacterium]
MKKINISLACFIIGIIGVIFYVFGVVWNFYAVGGWNSPVEDTKFSVLVGTIVPVGYALLLFFGLKILKYGTFFKYFMVALLIGFILQAIMHIGVDILFGGLSVTGFLLGVGSIIITVSIIRFFVDYKENNK